MTAEFDLIAAIRPLLTGDRREVPVGADDDAAVVLIGDQPAAVAVDTLVDGIHVDLGISTLADLGWKALAVNVSDLAAVGAHPVAAVVALLRPDGFGAEEARALYEGLRAGADRWGCALVGGDTVSAPTLAVSVTVLGRPVVADRPLRRSGARPGDVVLAVGPLGLAAAGLALVRAGADDVLAEHPDLLEHHRRPRPLVAAAAPLVVGGASAAIDVSDGLGRDLGHVARASGVAIRLEAARLPVHPGLAAAGERLGREPLDWVVAGGDDYAVVATVPGRSLARVETALEASGLRARVIGAVEEGGGVTLQHPDGREEDVARRGWEHR